MACAIQNVLKGGKSLKMKILGEFIGPSRVPALPCKAKIVTTIEGIILPLIFTTYGIFLTYVTSKHNNILNIIIF